MKPRSEHHQNQPKEIDRMRIFAACTYFMYAALILAVLAAGFYYLENRRGTLITLEESSMTIDGNPSSDMLVRQHIARYGPQRNEIFARQITVCLKGRVSLDRYLTLTRNLCDGRVSSFDMYVSGNPDNRANIDFPGRGMDMYITKKFLDRNIVAGVYSDESFSAADITYVWIRIGDGIRMMHHNYARAEDLNRSLPSGRVRYAVVVQRNADMRQATEVMALLQKRPLAGVHLEHEGEYDEVGEPTHGHPLSNPTPPASNAPTSPESRWSTLSDEEISALIFSIPLAPDADRDRSKLWDRMEYPPEGLLTNEQLSEATALLAKYEKADDRTRLLFGYLALERMHPADHRPFAILGGGFWYHAIEVKAVSLVSKSLKITPDPVYDGLSYPNIKDKCMAYLVDSVLGKK